ncbi:PaaI family thioesterase [Planomicrobium sp. CPCC 101110]|uniref:PaaI family thioesterase n=1 Tax=Planomicrobium sp. CPCC 101110 TaxID=2599619 RepID=UPI0011B764D8|nr:PaaI family thioesterase [Planomicrobium sp. CPCC 101110]TWT27466.1 PaaI family thioesterase [Planomicrobium sp. CPCC 101110]
MIEEKNNQLEAIQEQLQNFSTKELEELSYLISLYRGFPDKNRPKEIPMHFLGRFLGISQNPDGTAEMKLGMQNGNTYGVAQGGAIYTLADVAIGFSILQEISKEEKVFTLELKMNFIEKGEGARLLAKPVILRKGKSTVVAECSVTDETGKLVAKALGTFYIARQRTGKSGG